MSVTIHDVSQLAGVSSMSVSLAFRGSHRISASTRSRIFSAARRLGYVPNQAARMLRSGQTNIIGFIVNDISNPFHAQVLRVAEDYFSGLGQVLFSGSSGWSGSRELSLCSQLAEMRGRGVIICPCDQSHGGGLGYLRASGIPTVVIDWSPSGYDGAAVVNDLSECGRLMAEHFASIGVCRPGFVTGGAGLESQGAFRQLYDSFAGHLSSFGLTVSGRNRIDGGLTTSAGIEAFGRLRSQGCDADGIFCVNDLCAIGLMDAASRHGLFAGRDFALAGIDDLAVSGLDRISLTTIRQPYGRLAREASELLNGLISGQSPESTQISLSPTLVIRGSTNTFKKENHHDSAEKGL